MWDRKPSWKENKLLIIALLFILGLILGMATANALPIEYNWWKFESDGTDTKGHDKLAIYAGTPIYKTGKLGNAVEFGTTNDESLYNYTYSNITYKNITISVWVKLNATASTMDIYDIDAGANALYLQYETSAKNFRCGGYLGGGWKSAVSATYTTTQTWAHVVCTINPAATGKIKVWLNGVNGSEATSGTMPTLTNDVQVGLNINALNSEWVGGMDDMRIYFERINQSQVNALYNLGNGCSGNLSYCIEEYNKPVITLVNYSLVTSSNATINWTTSVASNTSVRYGLTKPLLSSKNIANSVTKHSVVLGGLIQKKLYYFNVSSCNGGYCGVSGVYNFTTKALVNLSSRTPANNSRYEFDEYPNLSVTCVATENVSILILSNGTTLASTGGYKSNPTLSYRWLNAVSVYGLNKTYYWSYLCTGVTGQTSSGKTWVLVKENVISNYRSVELEGKMIAEMIAMAIACLILYTLVYKKNKVVGSIAFTVMGIAMLYMYTQANVEIFLYMGTTIMAAGIISTIYATNKK